MAENSCIFILCSLRKPHTCKRSGNMFTCNDQLFIILMLGLESVYCGLTRGSLSNEILWPSRSPSFPDCRSACDFKIDWHIYVHSKKICHKSLQLTEGIGKPHPDKHKEI
jgi:hypothetical protein